MLSKEDIPFGDQPWSPGNDFGHYHFVYFHFSRNIKKFNQKSEMSITFCSKFPFHWYIIRFCSSNIHWDTPWSSKFLFPASSHQNLLPRITAIEKPRTLFFIYIKSYLNCPLFGNCPLYLGIGPVQTVLCPGVVSTQVVHFLSTVKIRHFRSHLNMHQTSNSAS